MTSQIGSAVCKTFFKYILSEIIIKGAKGHQLTVQLQSTSTSPHNLMECSLPASWLYFGQTTNLLGYHWGFLNARLFWNLGLHLFEHRNHTTLQTILLQMSLVAWDLENKIKIVWNLPKIPNTITKYSLLNTSQYYLLTFTCIRLCVINSIFIQNLYCVK